MVIEQLRNFYKTHKVKLWTYNLYDFNAAQEYLNKKESEGLELVTITRYLFCFAIFKKHDKPVHTSYSVDIKRKFTVAEQEDYIKTHKEKGYEFLPAEINGLVIFKKDGCSNDIYESENDVFSHLYCENVDEKVVSSRMIWGLIEVFLSKSLLFNIIPILGWVFLIHGALKLCYVAMNLIATKAVKSKEIKHISKIVSSINKIIDYLIMIPRVLLICIGILSIVYIIIDGNNNLNIAQWISFIVVSIGQIIAWIAFAYIPVDKIDHTDKHTSFMNYASIALAAVLLIMRFWG